MVGQKRFFLIVLVFTLFFSVHFYWQNKREKEILSYEFNGRVDNIVFDNKGFATITVKQKEFYLGVTWIVRNILNVGDSIIKNENKKSIKIIKLGTKEEIILND